MMEEILLIPVHNSAKDVCRWNPTSHGNFTVASAWELLRHKGKPFGVYNIIWNKGIIPTILVFLWRLLANRIPVDAKLQWRGLSLASKCRCCVTTGVETRLHLFVNGEAASDIWNHFARWFPQVPTFGRLGHNLEGRLRWWQRHLEIKDKHHICALIPCLILWYIWTERNGCVHREKEFKVENVCKRVVLHLRNLVLAGHLGPEHWSGCEPKVDFMGASTRRPKIRRVEKIHWRPPAWPWIKLNVDGAFTGDTNRAGGGGLIRDHLGKIAEAFCAPLAADSGLEAKMQALLEGILVAKDHSRHIWIESDGEVLSSMMSRGQLGPAKLRHVMVKIRVALKEISWRITHIRREGNKAADYLAGLGKTSSSLMKFQAGSVPGRVRALARLDQLGMPNFRFS